jgi:hypothetical protein
MLGICTTRMVPLTTEVEGHKCRASMRKGHSLWEVDTEGPSY